MFRQFRNRAEAGRLLAHKLGEELRAEEVIVLALPRGGIPVAAEIAEGLGAPLKVFVVRKLGVPWHEEYAMGAVASGGMVFVNQEVVDQLGLSSVDVRQVINREINEIERRERMYGVTGHSLDIKGRAIVLVDDGIATGSTMKAGIQALRQQEPSEIIVAVPVAPASARHEFEPYADAYFTLLEPEDFYAVGQWYDDFTQTSDAEVTATLKRFQHNAFAS